MVVNGVKSDAHLIAFVVASIVSKRASIVSQAILVRADSPYIRPQDLSNVPVAVHFHAGSHYLTLQMLEGFLSRDEIKVLHIPVNSHRHKALLDGMVRRDYGRGAMDFFG